MKKYLLVICLLAVLGGGQTALATAGKCCATVIGSNTASSCCAEPDIASGSVCASGQTEVTCSAYSSCPTVSGTNVCTTPTGQPTEATASTVPTTKAEFPILVPRIPLNIPTVSLQDFTNVTQAEGFLYIPFISVFLVGAYKLGVGIAAILAVIMIMIGGFIWIAAAGDSGKIGQAKTMIGGAVIGLVLTVGSYTLLQVVNPNLVNFTALKIPIVAPKAIEITDDFTPEIDNSGGGNVNTSSPSQYDDIFKKYAPCAGVTPEVLKAIAQAESGLNASKVNRSGYIGLFQTKQANCPAAVANYCTDLANPDNNTAAGAAMIKTSADTISSACPKANAHDQMVMIYIGHNMGPYALKLAVSKGCDTKAMRDTLINYYATNTRGMKTASSYAPKYQSGCLKDRTDTQALAECTGGPKFSYAEAIAKKSDGQISQVLATTSSGKCPY